MKANYNLALRITQAGMDFFGISYRELVGYSRKQPTAIYRQAIMAAVKSAGFSYPVTGQIFYRSHVTVIHAVRLIKERKKRGDLLAAHLLNFESQVAELIES